MANKSGITVSMKWGAWKAVPNFPIPNDPLSSRLTRKEPVRREKLSVAWPVC